MLSPSTNGPRKSAAPIVRPSFDAARKPGASSGASTSGIVFANAPRPSARQPASQGTASRAPSRSLLVGNERPQSEDDEEPDEDVDVLVLADEQDRDRIEADPHDQQPADRSRGREARQHQVEHDDDRALCRDQRDSHRQEERDVQRACDVIDEPDDDQRERRPLDDRRRDVRVRSARQRLRDRSPAVEIVGVRGLRPGCDDDGPNGPRAAEHDEEVRCRRRKPTGPSAPRQRHARPRAPSTSAGSRRRARRGARQRAAAARRSRLPASRSAR